MMDRVDGRRWGKSLALGISMLVNSMVYFGSRLLTGSRFHYDLSNRLDTRIPLLSWTIIIYLGCYLFWGVNYILGCMQEEEQAWQFLCADLLAKLVCGVVYLVFPTTLARPQIIGSSVFDEAMRWLYQTDAADNLFPSIHCLTSAFCVSAVRGNRKIPWIYRAGSLCMAVLVYISTMTTKQHVLVDVVAGILLAEGSFFLAGKTGLARGYRQWVEKGWTNRKKNNWDGK